MKGMVLTMGKTYEDVVAANKKYWWQYKPWREIQEQAKKCDIAILPMGAIEQHGPHLPTGHDTLQLFPMLEAVAERTGAMLLPCPWYGAHPSHHYKFPGTIPIRNDTFKALVMDIVRGASYAGFNKFIIFFGHGQKFAAMPVCQDLGIEGYFCLSVMFEDMVRDIHHTIMEMPYWHADESETSIALFTHGEYVDMSKAEPEYPTPLLDRKFVATPSEQALNKILRFDEGTLSFPEYKDQKIGVIGNPLIATEEKGEKYVAAVVDRFSAFIEHIKERYPAGTKIELT